MNVVYLKDYCERKIKVCNDSEATLYDKALREKRVKEIAKELTKGYLKLLSNCN